MVSSSFEQAFPNTGFHPASSPGQAFSGSCSDKARKDNRVTKILLIRHGHVDGIKPERFRGRAPLSLTAHGRAEAAAVAGCVARRWKPTRVYTSPMDRAVDTAAAIASACGIATPEACADLNDIDYGAWQFKTLVEAKAENPALFAAWFEAPHLVRFPTGESLQDLAARAANALRLLLARHPADAIVLVSHDSLNRALLLQFLGLPLSSYWRLQQSPCCLNEIDIADDKTRILRLNETGHLDEVSS
jgi:phosphoserine phosphatase